LQLQLLLLRLLLLLLLSRSIRAQQSAAKLAHAIRIIIQ
jgi:hypothetical protein